MAFDAATKSWAAERVTAQRDPSTSDGIYSIDRLSPSIIDIQTLRGVVRASSDLNYHPTPCAHRDGSVDGMNEAFP